MKSPPARRTDVFGWRRPGSVLSWLYSEPWQFEFFQAVRLLEYANPDAPSPGEGADPASELVILAANSSFAAPSSEIQSLTEVLAEFDSAGRHYTIFQPRVDRWSDDRLMARAASLVTGLGSSAPAQGIVTVSARTRTDGINRTVALEDIAIVSAEFPAVPEHEDELLDAIRERLPDWPRSISLDLLRADLVMSRSEAKAGAPPLMRVNFGSVGGAAGPLPYPDTEAMLERSYRKDNAMREFLDIFHHRTLSLLVRVRKSFMDSFTARDPSEGKTASYLFAFLGLGMYPGRTSSDRTAESARLRPLRNRLGVPDRALLYYSGILASHPRSASGLERFFSDYFGIPCRVEQLRGIWRFLEPAQWTRIGASGQNAVLGQTAIAGTRIWDQQGAIELHLGPMKLAQFLDFLPFGNGYRSLCHLTAFYAGTDLTFHIRLNICAREVPEARLSATKENKVSGGTFLGWTSWLRTRPFENDDSQVILSPPLSAR